MKTRVAILIVLLVVLVGIVAACAPLAAAPEPQIVKETVVVEKEVVKEVEVTVAPVAKPYEGLVPCDAETCPYTVDGAPFGGWSGGINAAADPQVKDAAYAFFSYMTQPAQSNVDVTIGITGFNPYRPSTGNCG